MTTITIHDPRHMDGDPHEVAEIAGDQLVAVLEHAVEALAEFGWAARGAWMTSEDHLTGTMPRGEDFWNTPQGLKLASLSKPVEEAIRLAETLTKAAAFNPRAPLGSFD